MGDIAVFHWPVQCLLLFGFLPRAWLSAFCGHVPDGDFLLSLGSVALEKQQHNEATGQRLPRGLVAAAIFPIIIPFVAMGVSSACDAANRRAAQPAIAALDAYHADYGDYPLDLDTLIPEYLSASPQTVCNLPAALRWDAWYALDAGYMNWTIYDCGADGIRLIVPLMSSQFRQIYNPETGHWSVGDAFDGYCY